MLRGRLIMFVVLSTSLFAQTAGEEKENEGWREANETSAGELVVQTGTRIPLSLINSVSTKHSAEGDRLYLETVFPIVSEGRVIIPPGSYVAGTITQVKRPGRIKGRGELYLRFDSLTLPNGVTRDFRARVGGLDGESSQELDREEGKIRSDTNKGGDARSVGEGAAAGTTVGVIAGSAAGRPGMGAGIGAAAGATAGLMGVLLTRGPDVVLTRGTTLEMILDRPLSFTADEVDFSGATMRRPAVRPSRGAPSNESNRSRVPMPGRGGWPY